MKEKLLKLYGKTPMTWKRTLIFAVICGVYTGLIMLVGFLDGTSFQDIGVTFEWWVVFAVIIVVNCDKPLEAALKCFVFFLISQPLVYLVQIPFGGLSLDMAKMYYLKTWLPLTFLTLPGGAVAYFCKKQSTFGAVVLGLGNTILLVMVVYYFNQMKVSFPHHLLTVFFCIAAMRIQSFCIQKEKRNRAISLILPVVLTAAVAVFAAVTGLVF